MRPCVVIIERMPDAAESLALLLQLSGFEPRVYADAAAALADARAARPAAAIVETATPGLDVPGLASKLRAAVAPSPLFLAALTCRGEDRYRAAARSAGFDFYQLKGDSVDDLLRLLAEHGGKSA
jgi:DNA-binding response OmpR family regulator